MFAGGAIVAEGIAGLASKVGTLLPEDLAQAVRYKMLGTKLNPTASAPESFSEEDLTSLVAKNARATQTDIIPERSPIENEALSLTNPKAVQGFTDEETLSLVSRNLPTLTNADILATISLADKEVVLESGETRLINYFDQYLAENYPEVYLKGQFRTFRPLAEEEPPAEPPRANFGTPTERAAVEPSSSGATEVRLKSEEYTPRYDQETRLRSNVGAYGGLGYGSLLGAGLAARTSSILKRRSVSALELGFITTPENFQVLKESVSLREKERVGVVSIPNFGFVQVPRTVSVPAQITSQVPASDLTPDVVVSPRYMVGTVPTEATVPVSIPVQVPFQVEVPVQPSPTRGSTPTPFFPRDNPFRKLGKQFKGPRFGYRELTHPVNENIFNTKIPGVNLFPQKKRKRKQSRRT